MESEPEYEVVELLPTDSERESDDSDSDDDDISRLLSRTSRKLLSSKLDIDAIEEKLMAGWQCCSKLQCSANATSRSILDSRFKFHCATATDRRHRLSRMVSRTHPVFEDRQVCTKFLRFALGISYNAIDNAKKMDSPERRIEHRQFAKMQSIVNYLDELATSFEQQPDSKEVHLSHPSRKEVYLGFEQEEHGHVSLSYFTRVWREERPHIKLRKHLRLVVVHLCRGMLALTHHR
jgi:hypothetical protein